MDKYTRGDDLAMRFEFRLNEDQYRHVVERATETKDSKGRPISMGAYLRRLIEADMGG